MIPHLIKLDFFEPGEQQTTIQLNAGNRDSVQLDFKIFKGATEVTYGDYTKAWVTFKKSDSNNVTGTASVMSDRIRYTPIGDELVQLLAKTGKVLGQIELFTAGNTKEVTLYFSITAVADLLQARNVASSTHLGQLESLIAEAQAKIDELQAIIDASGVGNLAIKDGTLQENLNADLLDGKDATDFAFAGFGLGETTTTALASVAELNAITKGGMFSIDTSNSPFGVPLTISHQQYLGDNFATQLLLGVNTPTAGFRHKADNVWSDIFKFWHSGNNIFFNSENGYHKFSNGFAMQWGEITMEYGISYKTVTFPVAFTTPSIGFAMPVGAAVSFFVGGLNVGSMNVFPITASAATAYWLALGHIA